MNWLNVVGEDAATKSRHEQSAFNGGGIAMQPASSLRDTDIALPVGTSPSLPASTVAFTNPYNVDAMVYVTGGTVTAVAVNGTATGLTSGAFRVSAGATITLTYSVAPTWKWFGGD